MQQREQILIKASYISIVGNAILSILKIVVGIFGGSLAVLGDGIDSGTDVIVSLVTLFTAKIISRPPNQKYAFGYEKAEDIATKVLSFIIFFAGLQMLISTCKNIFSEEVREMPSNIVIYVTVFSILGKLLLSFIQLKMGKKAESSMLIANAKNMRMDVLISTGVLIGLFFTFILKLPVLDSITGLLISLYIIKSAIEIFIESNISLMDGVKDPSVYNKIFEAVKKVPGVVNPHRVRSRQIGNYYMIDLDIEADGNITLREAHEISHQVEDSIKAAVENVYDIVVHVEPTGSCRLAESFGLDQDMIKEE